MKKTSLLFILVLLRAALCQAEPSAAPVLLIRQLPADGVLLDEGWRFRAGDSPRWADPGFDDGEWQPIDPALDVQGALPQIPRSGIVWLRLHLSLDSSVQAQGLVLMIQQAGASEIYLNGRLIHGFGVLHANPDKVRALNPRDKPVSFPVSNAGRQVLAVRFALQPHISYSTHWGTENSGLRIRVNTVENAHRQYQQAYVGSDKSSILRVGVFGILAILYLAFYSFHPSQKVNLYFSLYAFLQVANWAGFIYFHSQDYVEKWFLINNLLLLVQVVGFCFMLTAIYRLLGQRRGWFYYALLALGAVSVPTGAYIYGWGWLVFGHLFTNLINFDITRIAFRSIRHNKKGAWIIAAGGISFLVFWLSFTFQWFGYLGGSRIDFFSLACFSMPVAVSIYLGHDFALTNRSLLQKLREVEVLSHEKQQLLTSQKATLERQVESRTSELSTSLKELRATQTQLIQREKMASLGELTAGIAHEIQNPLNFVNNFSDVNMELVDELKRELEASHAAEAISIGGYIKENEQVINLHGKRADAIVKGMLQHSRASAGEKQLTNLNTLADEYLRLSYHGARAKDTDFSCALDTSFDPGLGKVEVVPQEIGRVLLNLFNNAFYAVQQKQRLGLAGYEPKVRVSTETHDGRVEIRVWDNGTGIPEGLRRKIFRPFFTTKPTGEGTGLGLSLSYDMVTKGHGGELIMTSAEGEWTEFTVVLPCVPAAEELAEAATAPSADVVP